MPAIVLAIVNAKYSHCEFGLARTAGQMGDLRNETVLLEFTIN